MSRTTRIGDGVTIRTEKGQTIRAGAALFATNVPVNDRVKVHTKQVPMRTYVDCRPKCRPGASRTRSSGIRYEPYHYVRLQLAGDGEDWLIVGGEDHRSGTANDMDHRFAEAGGLDARTFPGVRKGRAIAGPDR